MNNPYATARPSFQQTLDLFDGQWVSSFPSSRGELRAGPAGHFEDPRVLWAHEHLKTLGVDMVGSSVLELGPLEGGHTYMMSKLGARSVTAVEAHREAFLRCLAVKELMGIERVNFLYGDAVDFLRAEHVYYDVGFACGFLYHMVNPVELIQLLTAKTGAIFLWTVYWDPVFNEKHPDRAAATGGAVASEHQGFPHTLHRHDYGVVANYSKFWGGPAPHTHWMELDDILKAFPYFGFTRMHYELEQNPNGSALKLVAVRG